MQVEFDYMIYLYFWSIIALCSGFDIYIYYCSYKSKSGTQPYDLAYYYIRWGFKILVLYAKRLVHIPC